MTNLTKTTNILAALSLLAVASAWGSTTLLPIAENDTLLIDDFEDGNFKSSLGAWETFTGEGYNVKFTRSIVDADNGSKALHIEYTFTDEQENGGWEWVENRVLVGSSETDAKDLSSCTEIRFDYKMDYSEGENSLEFRFRAESDTLAYGDYNFHYMNLSPTSVWQTVKVSWNSLHQYNPGNQGVDFVPISVVQKDMIALSWFWHSDWAATGSLEIDNLRCVHRPTYDVKFYANDSLLDTKSYFKGERPSYGGDTTVETAKKVYDIVGWKPRLVPVIGDATYKAVMDSSDRLYKITFVDADGFEINHQNLPYGATPKYEGPLPTKQADWMNSDTVYSFKYWGKQVCDSTCYQLDEYGKCMCYYSDGEENCLAGAYEVHCRVESTGLLPVTGDTTYYPGFVATTKTYTVKFVDNDGTIISEKKYAAGTQFTAEDIPDDPERESKNGVDYTFESWIPYISKSELAYDLVSVDNDIVYVAGYTASDNSHTVAFVNGATILQIGDYADESSPAFEGTLPTKAPTEGEYYEFTAWKDQYGDELNVVTSNSVFTPEFVSHESEYWIAFRDEDGTLLDYSAYSYRVYPEIDALEYGGEKFSPWSDEYKFIGWDPAVVPAREDAEYVATFKYLVKCESYGETSSAWYNKGEIPTCSGTPTHPAAVDALYVFEKWDKEFAPVTAPTTYEAVYKEVAVPASKKTLEVADSEPVVFDNFEDDSDKKIENSLGGVWSSVEDSLPVGLSVNLVKAGDNRYLRVQDDLDEFAGVRMSLLAEGSVDVSKCEAFQYDYRGAAHEFRVESVYDNDWLQYYWEKPESDVWVTDTVLWNNYQKRERDDYAVSDLTVPVVQKRVLGLAWLLGEDHGTLEIDNVMCIKLPRYIAKFYNRDTLLYTTEVMYGNEPVYGGNITALENKKSNAKYRYTFSGWTPQILPATSDMNYTALFSREGLDDETVSVYFWSDFGYSLSNSINKGDCYGDYPEPKVLPSDEYEYTFVRWEPALDSCPTEDVYYKAVYDTTLRNASVVSSSSVEESSSSSSAVSSSSNASSSSEAVLSSSSSNVTTESSSSEEHTTLVYGGLSANVQVGFARNTLTVSQESASRVRVQVFDMQGLLLTQFDESFAGARDFDLSGLNRGNYVVRVSSRNGARTIRVPVR